MNELKNASGSVQQISGAEMAALAEVVGRGLEALADYGKTVEVTRREAIRAEMTVQLREIEADVVKFQMAVQGNEELRRNITLALAELSRREQLDEFALRLAETYTGLLVDTDPMRAYRGR